MLLRSGGSIIIFLSHKKAILRKLTKNGENAINGSSSPFLACVQWLLLESVGEMMSRGVKKQCGASDTVLYIFLCPEKG